MSKVESNTENPKYIYLPDGPVKIKKLKGRTDMSKVLRVLEDITNGKYST